MISPSNEHFDPLLKREVVEFNYKDELLRFPKELAGRYKISGLLTCGGYGALLHAKDAKIWDRNVLIKTGLFDKMLFMYKNNAALPRHIEDYRNQMIYERKMLLHGQLRGASGIPTLIDWFDDISPMVRGPHTAENGEVFTIDNEAHWRSLPYVVLSYFDGLQLDEFCLTSNHFKRNILGSCKNIGFEIYNTLSVFHEPQQFGDMKVSFIYQDLKPQNILVSAERIFCLIDFGSLAAITPNGIINANISSPGYAPPEASQGSNAVKPSWDIYSIGVILKVCFQLGSGIKQPKHDIPAEQISLSDNAKLPQEWIDFLNKCTMDNPTHRYQNLRSFFNDLITLPDK